MITLFLIGMMLKLSVGLLLLPFWLISLPFKLIASLFGKPKKKVSYSPTYQDGMWEGLIISSLWDD